MTVMRLDAATRAAQDGATVEPGIDVESVIQAPAGRVLKAFFDPQALHAWFQVTHAVTIPRALGPYALEWPTTDFSDEVLGRLGGVLHGTVMQFEPQEGFFVAGVYWLPPDGDPIGPMALEVTCTPADAGTHVRVRQSGYEESERWRRYYELTGSGWERALSIMRALLEK
jgi:uncharacterized protein YndB with AHSA1/START domain